MISRQISKFCMQTREAYFAFFDEPSPEFITICDVLYGCQFSRFIFTFEIDMVMQTVPFLCRGNYISISSDSNLADSEYADDVVLTNEYPRRMQFFLDLLNDNAGRFGMYLPSSECEMLTGN